MKIHGFAYLFIGLFIAGTSYLLPKLNDKINPQKFYFFILIGLIFGFIGLIKLVSSFLSARDRDSAKSFDFGKSQNSGSNNYYANHYQNSSNPQGHYPHPQTRTQSHYNNPPYNQPHNRNHPMHQHYAPQNMQNPSHAPHNANIHPRAQHINQHQHPNYNPQNMQHQSHNSNQGIKYCQRCGSPHRHFDKFCYKCGNRSFH